MQKLNKVPIDKFTDNNILCRAEFMYHVEQILPWCLVFGDEKPLKGSELFDCWGRVDPLTRTVEDLVVDSDWHNMYAIIGLCWIRCAKPPFLYTVHDGSNNASVFCDFVIQNSAIGFLQPGDFIVLDNASINHFQESTRLDSYLWNYHRIFLQFLPTCFPELNPIKLLWKFLTQQLRHFPLNDNYGPGMHWVGHAAEMLMNAFTHEVVDACYHHCGSI
jgi:hypothetical protein